MPYTGSLLRDPEFWRYQTQLQFVLTNGLALEIAYTLCRQRMETLITFKAGRAGPVDDITTHGVMCHKFCLENDVIHQDAIKYTKCSCLELSTQPHEVSYSVEGDWCKHNTGRMECDILGFCGFWECRIDDFMCPRYEYNKRSIKYAGSGDCKNAAEKYHYSTLIIFTCMALAAVLSFGIL